MRVNDKITQHIKDAKHANANRAICGGVYGENEGVGAVALERDHEVSNGVLFATPVKFVFHGKPGWVPDAAKRKSKSGGEGGSLVSLTQAVCL